jgi:hypothetical protein
MIDMSGHIEDRPVSRREAFGLGAAGAVGALVASILSPETAGAAAGDPLVLGQANDAGNATTSLTMSPTLATGEGDTLQVTKKGGDVFDAAVHGVAILAGNGVFGESNVEFTGDGAGVLGQNAAGGLAVLGTASASQHVPLGIGAVGVYGIAGDDTTSGAGVLGYGASAVGVYATTQSSDATQGAVYAENSGGGNGVYATTDSAVTDDVSAVRAVNQGTGVGGYAESDGGPAIVAKDTSVSTDAYGVHAQSSGGTGVYGASTDGVGIFADTFDGTALTARGQAGIALDVQGTARFSTSGLATVKGTVATPKSAVKVSGVALTTNSIVLATIQSNNAPGVFIQSAVPHVAGSYIIINLNKAVTKFVKVAWFVLN